MLGSEDGLQPCKAIPNMGIEIEQTCTMPRHYRQHHCQRSVVIVCDK